MQRKFTSDVKLIIKRFYTKNGTHRRMINYLSELIVLHTALHWQV